MIFHRKYKIFQFEFDGNLNEMSDLILCEKYENYHKLSTDNLTYGVLKLKICRRQNMNIYKILYSMYI